MAGQRLMQAATDIFLGWQRIKGLDGVTRDYYARQFRDWKGGIVDFSRRYADQNERDYEAFAVAVNSGRLTAQTGV